MEQPKKIKMTELPDGSRIFYYEVAYDVISEPWQEYRIRGEDGHTLRLRPTVTKIVRITDEQGNPQFSNDGEPIYSLSHSNQLTVSDSLVM